MYKLKVIALGKNIPNINKAVGTVLSRARQNADKAVEATEKEFVKISKNSLKWHPWRGGVGDAPGTFEGRTQRMSKSKVDGYLSTGIPKFSKFVGKGKLEFGFGDVGRIKRLFTRDGTQNLVDLLEYGARPHTISHGKKKKSLFYRNKHGKLIFRKKVEHKGFEGKFIYARTLAFMKEKVGLFVVSDIKKNGLRYIQESATGQIRGSMSKVASRLYK